MAQPDSWGWDPEQSHSVACPSTAHVTCVLDEAECLLPQPDPSYLTPLLVAFYITAAYFRCPKQAGLSPWTYLSFWILQVGFRRPWSTRHTPASPSSLVHRLSSVKVGLAWTAELMSLHRTSVTPQSSSLQTGPLGQHGTGLRFNHHLTQPTRSQEIQIWIRAIMFKLETGMCGGWWIPSPSSVWARKLSQKTRTRAACLACTKSQH